jgi:hypothetical protein
VALVSTWLDRRATQCGTGAVEGSGNPRIEVALGVLGDAITWRQHVVGHDGHAPRRPGSRQRFESLAGFKSLNHRGVIPPTHPQHNLALVILSRKGPGQDGTHRDLGILQGHLEHGLGQRNPGSAQRLRASSEHKGIARLHSLDGGDEHPHGLGMLCIAANLCGSGSLSLRPCRIHGLGGSLAAGSRVPGHPPRRPSGRMSRSPRCVCRTFRVGQRG